MPRFGDGPSSRRRPLGAALGTLALALAAAGCNPTCPPDFHPVVLPEFMLGLSQTPANVVPLAQEVGARYIRPTLSWRSLESTVTPLGLTVDEVRANPALVASYATSHDWSYFDGLLGGILGAGLVPVPIVGHGYVGALPTYAGNPADPDRLGREDYLAYIYLVTRATVERYDADGALDAPGSPRVDYWQTENELNQAFLTALWGWRSPSLSEAFGSAWQDFPYVTRIMSTLRLAVKDADASALTTMNFHTDIIDEINQALLQPTWMESIQQWRFQMDILGMDAYPNYYRSEPPRGTVLGERVLAIQGQSCGMPIVVMETGYPTGPAIEGFDDSKQATFIQDAFTTSHDAGAQGFFLFGTQTSEVLNVEITPEDLANLELVADAYESGDVGALIGFLLTNWDYIETHFVHVLQAVEPFWGIVRPDGSHKPGWDVFHAIAQSTPTRHG